MIGKPLRIDPRNMFIPKQAIRDELVTYFSGRREELGKVLDMAAVPGSAVIVFGERGIGKTSLGWQAFRILSGERDIFRELQISSVLPIRSATCLWLQCSSDMYDVEGMILNLIRISPGRPAGSLAAACPDILIDQAFHDSIQQTYKVDLKLVSAEWKFGGSHLPTDSSKHLERRSSVHALFRDIMSYVADRNPAKEIIIFLDDVNNLPSRAGLGHLIKNTSAARFFLIARTSPVDELIADEESVRRKVVGSALEIPSLSEREINWIFDRAEAAYPDRVWISPSFRKRVIDESYGLPWAVQQFGYSAAFARVSTQPELEELRLTDSDFESATGRLARDENQEYGRLLKLVGDSNTRQAIIRGLTVSPGGSLEEDDFRGIVPRKKWKTIDTHLDALIEGKVLKRDSLDRVRFYEPITMILAKLAVRNGFAATE